MYAIWHVYLQIVDCAMVCAAAAVVRSMVLAAGVSFVTTPSQ